MAKESEGWWDHSPPDGREHFFKSGGRGSICGKAPVKSWPLPEFALVMEECKECRNRILPEGDPRDAEILALRASREEVTADRDRLAAQIEDARSRGCDDYCAKGSCDKCRVQAADSALAASLERGRRLEEALREARDRIAGTSGPKTLHAHYTVGDANFDTPLLAKIDALVPRKEVTDADR